MKRNVMMNRGVAKGAPSGLLISVLVHAAAFLLAGMFVVFTVVNKSEKKFVPPKPIDRPKMKLRKPKVKIKKSAMPKSTTRIVTKVKRASMPDIQLPEMSGTMGNIDGSIGGFEIMPDLAEISTFGSSQTIGNDFVGTFYDTKRDRRGKDLPEKSREAFIGILEQFLKKGFRKSLLSPYYKSPKKLYTTTFAMPPDLSLMAPQAFGEDDTVGYFWLAHYEGKLVYPEDITFRFWGAGDDVLAVRVDGEYVLLSVAWSNNGADALKNIWRSRSADSGKYPLGNKGAVVGDWITLKAGEPLDMEVVIAEIPGGNFQALLCVEVQGVDYPRNPFRNGPTLPIFKTEEPTLDLMEAIHASTHEGDLSVTNGPIFRDYISAPRKITIPEIVSGSVEPEEPPKQDQLRTWTVDGGAPIEAELVMGIGDLVVLKTRKGKQVKVEKEKFSGEDLHYISLASLPEFTIDFKTNRRQVPSPEQPPNTWVRPITIFEYEFGAKISQRSSRDYPYELTVELFAIGDEVDGDNYVLLDRQEQTFRLAAENKKNFLFKGDKVRTIKKAILPDTPLHGVNYSGYLVTITDELGRIIQYTATREFLFENLDALKQIPIGKHFDKNCNYASPPRFTFRDRESSW
ncbi:hypothetical protein [Pontiella agarivorans]|uniref:PA14 domain-containing protein n=1 Tax=Pontiella agarivorans TaxID=3038953 RepID=A0ABU5MW57_9BACT|nr:hypothetical protein [Pontiella agarivorans]MDZ8118437.1 hypothetical protein [Pontiella agarivorans]